MNGPQDTYQRFLWGILRGLANAEGLAAASPAQLADAMGVHQKTVSKLLVRLEEGHWIERISQNAWNIHSLTRARAIGSTPVVDLPILNADANECLTPLPTYSRGPSRKVVNQESSYCQECGETGWIYNSDDEVEPCKCRGEL